MVIGKHPLSVFYHSSKGIEKSQKFAKNSLDFFEKPDIITECNKGVIPHRPSCVQHYRHFGFSARFACENETYAPRLVHKSFFILN
jgi:hypothetical protein